MQETAVNIPEIIFSWQYVTVVCLTVIVAVIHKFCQIILLVRKTNNKRNNPK